MAAYETFRRTSDVAWRSLAIGVAVLAVGALLWKLKLVVLPLFIAVLLCAALVPLVTALERRRWPTLLAAWLVFLGFLLAIAGAMTIVIPRTVSQLDQAGDAIEQGLADFEDWLVDGPFGLSRSTVEDYTDDPGARIGDWVRSSSDTIRQGVVTVGEVLAGLVLALVLTFLVLKDGRRIQQWLLERTPEEHRPLLGETADAAWTALTGFLRGAAVLGLVEGTVIGLTVWIVGAPLALSVGVFTFLAAFFPLVGAVVAGALATLIVLATTGTSEAIIVLVVVIVVQQLDGDVLAPMIYGRSLSLHPIIVLTVLTAGAALGGIVGAFVSVPVTAVVVSVGAVLWRRQHAEPA